MFIHPPCRRRTKPSSPVVRPPTALAASRRRVAAVFTMDVHVAGQDILPEEVTAQSGWLTARSRRSKRSTDNLTATDESSQAPSNRPRSRARQPVKSQVLKAGRMPPLPTEDIKIVIRPKGALHIAKIGSPVVTAAILQAGKLTDEESLEDTVRPNAQQNIVVVSTPHSDHADRHARISSIQVNGVTHEPPQPYSFGYDSTDEFGTQLFHKEQGDASNAKTGSYGYRDANGLYRTVTYVADANGFRATVDTNEPGTAPGASADAMFNAKPVAAPAAALGAGKVTPGRYVGARPGGAYGTAGAAGAAGGAWAG
ncbi:hypothetical protein HPB49_002468 [Dermacentor silvarum]|uniref:Uncharacterized protein n=1 Tax=Dermacentor silvarum TaxID=543639 RepID=A0ACB8DAG1_DERSI|nr:hypothetical protein HPB49_002468 [Dermacentor silvarum]